MLRFCGFAWLVLLASCASHSGSVTMQQNGDWLTKQSAFRPLQADMVQEATSFCELNKMDMQLVRYHEKKPWNGLLGYTRAELQFQCLVKPSIPEQSGRKGG